MASVLMNCPLADTYTWAGKCFETGLDSTEKNIKRRTIGPPLDVVNKIDYELRLFSKVRVLTGITATSKADLFTQIRP
jgi:hypothetical protein